MMRSDLVEPGSTICNSLLLTAKPTPCTMYMYMYMQSQVKVQNFGLCDETGYMDSGQLDDSFEKYKS